LIGLSYPARNKGSNYGSIRKAKRVQAKRSSWAKHIDECLKAPMAKSPEEWMANPNRLDLPNVDMNKPKKETKSMNVDENRITISQFKDELIKAIKEHPEWKTASNELQEKLLHGIEHKPKKIQELRQSYINSGKPITEWLKNAFD